jgi:pimeloyl-ACP methyl ester carboxylesterase
MFARLHPEKVRALVFIDGLDSGALPELTMPLDTLRRSACLAAPAAGIGLLRALNPLELNGETAALTYRPAPFYSACSLLRELPETDRMLAMAPALATDIPLLVLTHTQPRGLMAPGNEDRERAFDPIWQKLQRQLAARSTKGRQVSVENAGHLIAGDRPDAVAQGILSML